MDAFDSIKLGEGIEEDYLIGLDNENLANCDKLNTKPLSSDRGDDDTAEKTITDNRNVTPSPKKQKGKDYGRVLDIVAIVMKRENCSRQW